MKIINVKKTCLKVSFILILTGLIISFIGFGMSGFDRSAYKTAGENHWYRTINL
ncbi:hypothetical protein [Clostridium estertheticum]|uniref:hypothetical protein n=1 Tax=Clostridium estertheticum TaxID=238834 RepID=UPI00129D2233|nr:hypothetical protein [Clostridium estertheticum]MBU3074980.1 hypothetical protein [Clostridium estertheticum]MBU3165195.1 hypothetical protein [Clostridium estertheticum]MCB2338793.1 hypothetical protein [Clostridium estertheticum]